MLPWPCSTCFHFRHLMADASRSGDSRTPLPPLVRLEPYGMLILIGLLFILPALGAQTGVDVNIVWRFIAQSADAIINAILRLAGN